MLLESSFPATPTYLQISWARDEMHYVPPYTRSDSFQIRLDPYRQECGHVSKYLSQVRMQETYGCTAHPSRSCRTGRGRSNVLRWVKQQTFGNARALPCSCSPPDNNNRLTPTAVFHGQEWSDEEVTIPMGGPVVCLPWSVRCLQRDIITESTGFPLYDSFLAAFPYAHFGEIAQFLLQKRAFISIGELLKFFGVLVPLTRFGFGKRHAFWKGSPTSKYIPAPAFGKTGMSRNRFDEILQCVRSDRQTQPWYAGCSGLGKKGGIHDWPFRVNRSSLGLIVVDAWLVYSGGRGVRTGMDQRDVYEQLADQLIDTYFDSVGLCDHPSDLDKPGVAPRGGIGAHPTPTKKKSIRAVPVLHSSCKESAASALLRQLTLAPFVWMTVLRADRPGFVRKTTVNALAYSFGAITASRAQLHCI
jgi:hypothetical protein